MHMPYRFKCPRCGSLWDVPAWKVALNPHFILVLPPKYKSIEGVDRVLLKCPACGKRDYMKYLGKIDTSRDINYVAEKLD